MGYIGLKDNHVYACGIIRGEFTYDHQSYGEKIYRTFLEVERLSETSDKIPIFVPGRLVDVEKKWDGHRVWISGGLRSYNSRREGERRLLVYLFATTFDGFVDDEPDANDVYLEGYICKDVTYRETPMGRRISDTVLAVNRYRKSDYIPCIAWGWNASLLWSLDVGCHVRIHGRMQSREYVKRISDDEKEIRTTYEVSINSLEVIEDAVEEKD